MTYTDVTPIELWGGWIIVGVFVVIAVLKWGWKRVQTDHLELLIEQYEQMTKTLSGRETADLIKPWSDACLKWELRFRAKENLHNQDLLTLSRTIDKLKSLEAQITRLTVRPRGKNGRFEKKTGD